jgi:two-component system phosphate regulon sensor histidine kinase PhoR
MKLNRSNFFIAISSLALVIVLIIQVNWILQTAKIKEEFFNEKANMVLARTTEALRMDKETCSRIGDCVAMEADAATTAKLGIKEKHKIDSLFTYFMQFYNFHIYYTFSVAKPLAEPTSTKSYFSNTSYYKPLEGSANTSGVELKLILPDKKHYIIAEMGVLFITSVILILIVLVLFWQTILSLTKEKKLSEHTSDFLNNMTHEFKTPLTTIALAGKMILKDVPIVEGNKAKQYAEIILAENEKLRLQVEQMLSMTALERGEIPILKKEVDFHLLITETVKSMKMQLESKQVDYEINLNANRCKVIGDKTHLHNILCNLIGNAINYSKAKPKIIIQTLDTDNALIIKVSDNGIGIEKKYLQNVFDNYFRIPTGDVHNVKGFGLGLAYVKKIVELHNGTIKLQSTKGIGTTFTITLLYA